MGSSATTELQKCQNFTVFGEYCCVIQWKNFDLHHSRE